MTEHVEWRSWTSETFAVAERTDRPVLLSLVVPWSAECREMMETTYAEPRVAAHINDRFVPVRVDADRNPPVRERYTMGGFPSTVFLTPSGKIIAGATYLGVDGVRQMLERVEATWQDQGEAAGSVPRAIREGTPPSGEPGPHIEEAMVEQLLGAFDEDYGGWGRDAKFPLPRTIEFALVRVPEQARRTLDAVQTHLLDADDGGFYRLARNRDWGNVRGEKLTDETAALVRAFAHGYRYTGDEAYRETARRGIEYLTSTLWTGEAFAASQGGEESDVRLDSTTREGREGKGVDSTVFADRNGLAIDALLQYVAYTDDHQVRRYATRAREHVCTTLVDDGRVTHYSSAADERSPSGLLLDQARVLRALATSWSVCGESGPARAVADWTLAHLQAEGGAFRDGPPGDAGTVGAGQGGPDTEPDDHGDVSLLASPLYPLDTTIECADALLDLSILTGKPRYRERAREAVRAFAGASDRMGVEVAGYATVVSRLREPTAIEVGTDAGTDLHRAALRLADHESVVVPEVRRNGLDSGEARLLVDGELIGHASTPEALEQLMTSQ